MADSQSSNNMQSADLFELRPAAKADKNAFLASRTDLNTLSGCDIVKEANRAKQVPSDFRSKDGSDIELTGN